MGGDKRYHVDNGHYRGRIVELMGICIKLYGDGGREEIFIKRQEFSSFRWDPRCVRGRPVRRCALAEGRCRWQRVAGRRGRAPMGIEGAKGHSAHAGHGCMSEMFRRRA